MEKGAVIVYFDVENNKPGYEYHDKFQLKIS